MTAFGRLLAFILIAVLPAAAVVVYDQDGPHLRVHVAAALVLGAVLGLFAAWASRRRFVHEPLQNLIACTRALREGRYPPRGALAAGAGEFASVARAFDDMAAQLAAREAALRESEQRFRRLSDASFEGVAIHDGERIIETNAAARLFGYEPEEVIGMPLAAFLAPEARAQALATARAEAEARYESVGLRKDGSTFPVEFRGRRIEHEGRQRRIVAIRHLTEQRNAAAALRESERLARARLAEIEAVYATAPVGLCVFDRDLRFVRINERKAAMHGYPPAAHIGRSIRELLPEVAARVEPLLRRVIESGEPLLNVEFTGETPAQPGVRRVWNENWFPLRDPAGRVIAVNAVAEEITERKRAEERLKLLAAEVDHRAKNMLALV